MAARSCTPPRTSTSPDGTPFVCYHRLSDYPLERSCSPPTPKRQRNSWGYPANDLGTEMRPSQLMTPKASRVESQLSQAALCTPQTMREELQLRANLDAELSLVRLDRAWRPGPSVTPLVDGLYVGGLPDEETLEYLRREGIDTIINCCAGEYETRECEQAEFKVHSICAEDQSDYLILYHCYDRFAEIVNEARRASRRVFVHCIAGINRSVTLCIAYIMQHYHMDPVSCVRFIRARGRTDILRNVAFRHQLVDFYLNTPST
ncbi:putative dual specificity protein phosphatase [Trypanosoma grayi]|uniref:putative dual specificity protein phosphatase n=1 Tax=Trypanosoma grayi TaxID=71804 RepID=UPI0004F43D80|nr:putative dual specificity protein phosphatase [Trypanosoma grayi]KEG10830.1 putative dual specificity protein phosphatase [Trypanosoma grayi]